MNRIRNMMHEKIEEDKKKNYEAILSKVKIKGGMGMKKRYILVLAFSLILILVVAIGLNRNVFNNEITKQIGGSKVEIKINKLNDIEMLKLDADIKNLEVDEIPKKYETLKTIKIPEGFYSESIYAVYVRENIQTEEYNILNNYVMGYRTNESAEKDITISFSDTYEPLRDYFIDKENSKVSDINGIKLVIYNYKEMYITKFEYNGIKFDIETSGISEEEFINLLVSIIK